MTKQVGDITIKMSLLKDNIEKLHKMLEVMCHKDKYNEMHHLAIRLCNLTMSNGIVLGVFVPRTFDDPVEEVMFNKFAIVKGGE